MQFNSPLSPKPTAPASASGTPGGRKSADIIRGIEIQYHNDTSTNKVDLLVELLKAAILKKHTASSGLFGNHKDRAGVIRAFRHVLEHHRWYAKGVGADEFVQNAKTALDFICKNPAGSIPGGSESPPGGGVSQPMPHITTLSQRNALKAAEIRGLSLKSDRVTPEDVTRLIVLITDSDSPSAQQHAAEALRNFSFNADSCKALVENGFHEKLGQLLIDKKVSSIAKQYAAEAISNLSNDDANYGPLQDVLAPLLEYFEASPPDSYGAQHALWAMINLTKKSGDETGLQDGVDLQLVQLSKLESSSTGREYAVKAAKLSSDPANHKRLMDNKVDETLKKILENAAVVPLAKEFAAKALLNLSIDAANSERLGAGIGAQLVGILSGDATDKAKEYAALALLNISSDEAHRKALVDAGVYAKLEKLINNSKAEPSASAYAQGAAFNFLNNEQPTVIQPQTPVSSTLDAAGAVLIEVVGVVINGFGTVQEGVVAALDTAQNKVADSVNLLRGWFK